MKLPKLSPRQKVVLNKITATIWILLIFPAYKWWSDLVFFVIICSIYANIKSDLATAEAADNTEVVDMLKQINKKLDEIAATRDQE